MKPGTEEKLEIKKMDPKVKALWIKALESGEYEQGKHMLRNMENEYCCLGVLCDIHSKPAKSKLWGWGIRPTVGEGYAYGGKRKGTFQLPATVSRWAGLTVNDPYVSFHDTIVSMSRLNDKLGLTFKEIAELIKNQL